MAKFKSKGATLKAEAANPPTVSVGQLGDFTFDLGEREGLIDVTTHDNATGVAEQLDNGFKTPCSLSGELLYDPAAAVHEVLRSAQDAGTALYFLVTLPDSGAATFLFQGRVKSISMPLPVKGKLSINIMIEGTGAYTFTA